MRRGISMIIVMSILCIATIVSANQNSSKDIVIRHKSISMTVDSKFSIYLQAAAKTQTKEYDLIGDYMYKKGKYYYKYEVVASSCNEIIKVFLYKFIDDIVGYTETIDISKKNINNIVCKISKGGFFSFDQY